MAQINPYLTFPGNTEEAFKFYQSVFGGELRLTRFKEMPIEGVELTAEQADKVMHVALPIGSSMLMASDPMPGMRVTVGDNISVSYHPDSRADADRVFSGLAEGGKVTMPLAVAPWGDYFGMLTDRFGINWMVNYHGE